MQRLGISALILVLIAVSSSASAASTGSAEKESEPTVTVATSAYPLFEAITAVGGDDVEVHNVAPISALDDEALSPEDQDHLSEADLAVIIGKGTQPRIEATTRNRGGRTLAVLDSIETAPSALDPNTITAQAWLDPAHMANMVEQIQKSLSELSPNRAQKFESRAGHFRARLARTDRQYAHQLAACERRQLVTATPSFTYLADRYGLQQIVAKVPGSVKSEGLGFEEALRVHKPTTVFAPALPETQIARKLFESERVRIAVLDSLENRTDQARRGGATYETVMRLNLDALKEALGCADAFGGK